MAELTVSVLFCPTTGISKCFVHINNIHKICIRPVSRAMHFNLYKFDYNPMIIVRLQKCSALFFFLYLCLGLFFPLLILNPLDFLLILCANTELSAKNCPFRFIYPFFLYLSPSLWVFSNNNDSNIIRLVGIWFDIAIYDAFFIYSNQNINHNSLEMKRNEKWTFTRIIKALNFTHRMRTQTDIKKWEIERKCVFL